MFSLIRSKIHLRIVQLLVATSGLLFAGHSLAVCSTGNQQYTVQVPLQAATFSAGEDFPVGSNILFLLFRGYTSVTVTCINSVAF